TAAQADIKAAAALLGETAKQAGSQRPVSGVGVRDTRRKTHCLGVLHAHGDRGVTFSPKNMRVIKPAIGEAGLFGLFDQITSPFGADEPFKANTEFHCYSPVSVGTCCYVRRQAPRCGFPRD